MPDEARTFKVYKLRRNPAIDPKRRGKWDKIVIYELPDGERDAVVMPEETFDEAAMVAAVKADLQEKGKWQNKTFQL